MTGSDGRPAAPEQLGHDVERLVVAVCVAGSAVLGGLVLLAVFVVVVLVAADTGLPKPSATGISGLGPSPLEMGTGTPGTDRIVPGQIDGLPPATTDGGLIPGGPTARRSTSTPAAITARRRPATSGRQPIARRSAGRPPPAGRLPLR